MLYQFSVRSKTAMRDYCQLVLGSLTNCILLALAIGLFKHSIALKIVCKLILIIIKSQSNQSNVGIASRLNRGCKDPKVHNRGVSGMCHRVSVAP